MVWCSLHCPWQLNKYTYNYQSGHAFRPRGLAVPDDDASGTVARMVTSAAWFTPSSGNTQRKNRRETKRVSTLLLELFPTAVCSRCVSVWLWNASRARNMGGGGGGGVHCGKCSQERRSKWNVTAGKREHINVTLKLSAPLSDSFGLIPISVVPCLSLSLSLCHFMPHLFYGRLRFHLNFTVASLTKGSVLSFPLTSIPKRITDQTQPIEP